jgi:hypothetical protein
MVVTQDHLIAEAVPMTVLVPPLEPILVQVVEVVLFLVALPIVRAVDMFLLV